MKDLWKYQYSTSDVLAIQPGLTSMDIRNHRRRGLLATDRSKEKIGKERVLSLLTVYEIVLLTTMQDYGWSVSLASEAFRFRLIEAPTRAAGHETGSKALRRLWARVSWEHPKIGPAVIRALEEFEGIDTSDPVYWCITSIPSVEQRDLRDPKGTIVGVEVRKRREVGSSFYTFYHVLNVTDVIARADSILTERLIERGEIDP